MAPGCTEFDENRVTMVMSFLKSFFDVRQTPSNLWRMIDEHLMGIGFKILKSDPCVYIYSESFVVVIWTLHVDNVVLFGKHM